MNRLEELYSSIKGVAPIATEKLPGAGSNRKYYRLTGTGGFSVIGVAGTSLEENRAFVSLARHFRVAGLPVPEVLVVSPDGMCYLQQDLGSTSLFDAVKDGRASGEYSAEEENLLTETVRQLPHFQLATDKLDFSVCYPQPEFDRRNVMFDLNYFKYSFLKATGVDFHEILLEDDFEKMASELTGEHLGGFMYRDFQARNVMLVDGKPFFIDFQGGRRGPVYYDVASFVWQASARYSDALRSRLVWTYYEELRSLTNVPDFEEFNNRLRLFVLFRTLQVLGAYGFRGYFERKQHFINSIPPALENLNALIDSGACNSFPYLKKILASLVAERLVPTRQESCPSPGVQSPRLVVRVFSFSYKKGIPEDTSGNGGGYVFDCRSTNNPGRYKEYRHLTGRDQEVIDFLEKDGEILRFLDSVYPLVDFHVQRWLNRGFTSLQVSFGCTGGQHRSVYSAQHVAEHLQQKFGSQIKIELTHREQRPQAFILAAGLGTRLKPLTDTKPKALVRVGKKTLLERTIETLQAAGFQNIVINTHHFAQQIKAFVKDFKDPEAFNDLTLTISDETSALLDTGGGLLKARHQFSQARPILIHNVDILSNADLKGLYSSLPFSTYPSSGSSATIATASGGSPVIATLLVSRRETSRYLHFDCKGNLIGWQNIKTGEVKGRLGTPLAFSGIHVVSPQIFPFLEEYAKEISPSFAETKEIPKFSITDFYIWACQKATIKAHIQEDLQLTDVGKLAVLEQLLK